MHPIGYVYDADHWCESCLRKAHVSFQSLDVNPIWESEEADHPMHCCQCHEFLGGNLTRDGVRNLQKKILEGELHEELIRLYTEYFEWADWYVFRTFAGCVDYFGGVNDIGYI